MMGIDIDSGEPAGGERRSDNNGDIITNIFSGGNPGGLRSGKFLTNTIKYSVSY
jgi:hypothetical protein